jgi:hypothetical protein
MLRNLALKRAFSTFWSGQSAFKFTSLELGDPSPRLDQTAEDAPQRLVGQFLQALVKIIQFIEGRIGIADICSRRS